MHKVNYDIETTELAS